MSFKLILNKDKGESIIEYGSIEQAFDAAQSWITRGYVARMTDEQGIVKYTQVLTGGQIATYPGDATDHQDTSTLDSSLAKKPWWKFWGRRTLVDSPILVSVCAHWHKSSEEVGDFTAMTCRSGVGEMTTVSDSKSLISRTLGFLLVSIVSSNGVLRSEELAKSLVLQVPKSIRRTMLAFEHEGPPPWPDGNIAFVDEWQLLNLHAENLFALRDERGVKSLTIQPLDRRYALVIDKRVGKEWFTSQPLMLSLDQQLEIIRRHRNHFAILSETQELLDSEWKLVERHQIARRRNPEIPEKLIEKILPGTKLDFQESQLVCRNDRSKPIAVRDWLVRKSRNSVSLAICVKDGDIGESEALYFSIAELGERLTLAPTWWQKKGGLQLKFTSNHENASLLYQRVSRN